MALLLEVFSSLDCWGRGGGTSRIQNILCGTASEIDLNCDVNMCGTVDWICVMVVMLQYYSNYQETLH